MHIFVHYTVTNVVLDYSTVSNDILDYSIVSFDWIDSCVSLDTIE